MNVYTFFSSSWIKDFSDLLKCLIHLLQCSFRRTFSCSSTHLISHSWNYLSKNKKKIKWELCVPYCLNGRMHWTYFILWYLFTIKTIINSFPSPAKCEIYAHFVFIEVEDATHREAREEREAVSEVHQVLSSFQTDPHVHSLFSFVRDRWHIHKHTQLIAYAVCCNKKVIMKEDSPFNGMDLLIWSGCQIQYTSTHLHRACDRTSSTVFKKNSIRTFAESLMNCELLRANMYIRVSAMWICVLLLLLFISMVLWKTSIRWNSN